jgi:Calcineurin-like phosphoesterase
MPAGKVTDGEFIEIWRLCQGNSEQVAKKVGTNRRNVMDRRRRIEARHNLRLESTHQKAHHYKHLSPTEHSARKTLAVDNGVVLVFSDAHFWPGVRTTAFKALLMLIREMKPVAIINNGDAFDGASISRFPRIMFLDRGPSVIDELKACKERLSEIEDAANGAKLYWPLGNHDARFETRLAQVAPEFEGIAGFHLKDHFPAWAPCWSVWINDAVVIKHRLKGGIHATRNNTLNAGKTTFTGHLHQLKVTPLDDYNGTRWGVDTGTLAEPNGPQFQDYTEDGFKDWRSGFAVATFYRGQLLWPELCRVLEFGKVDFRGQVIDVSAE